MSRLRRLFYKEKTKIVPHNIGEFLTKVGLAFWIMDDGGAGTHGELILHTHSYTSEEVDILINTLKLNFDIYSRKTLKRPLQWTILIPKKEVEKVKKLVLDYLHPSMYYKTGIKNIA